MDKSINRLKFARFNSIRLNFITPYKVQPKKIRKIINCDRITALADNSQFYKWLDTYIKENEYLEEEIIF